MFTKNWNDRITAGEAAGILGQCWEGAEGTREVLAGVDFSLPGPQESSPLSDNHGPWSSKPRLALGRGRVALMYTSDTLILFSMKFNLGKRGDGNWIVVLEKDDCFLFLWKDRFGLVGGCLAYNQLKMYIIYLANVCVLCGQRLAVEIGPWMYAFWAAEHSRGLEADGWLWGPEHLWGLC